MPAAVLIVVAPVSAVLHLAAGQLPVGQEHSALPAVPMTAAAQALAAVLTVAALTASLAAALKTDTDSVMGSGLWGPAMLQWRLGGVGEEDVALVQQQDSAACERDAPTALAVAHVRGSGHEHFELVTVRRCFELASAEQALAVRADVHAAVAVAGPTAVLAAVQAAALPAELAADQQLMVPRLYLLQSRTKE